MDAYGYVDAAVEFAAATQGANPRELDRKIDRSALSGGSPTIYKLLRIEKLTGLGLDMLDARIREGMRWAGKVPERARRELWQDKALAELLGCTVTAARKLIQEGGVSRTMRAEALIRLTELMEGRLSMPEEAGAVEQKLAREALRQALNETAINFRLKRVGNGLWKANGNELRYLVELRRDGARVTAVLKDSGIVILDRVFGV